MRGLLIAGGVDLVARKREEGNGGRFGCREIWFYFEIKKTNHKPH
jgi:hypothetical protein